MNTESEEIKLTSYALDELKDENARREIEARLEHDEAARREVESIRAMAGMLKDELAKEPLPAGMSPQTLHAPLKLMPPIRLGLDRVRRPRWKARLAVAAAACVVLGGVTYSIVVPKLNRARELASGKPSANLRQIGPAITLDANDNRGASPRTPVPSAAPAPKHEQTKADFDNAPRFSLQASGSAAPAQTLPQAKVDSAAVLPPTLSAVSTTPAPAASIAPTASYVQSGGTLTVAGGKVSSNSLVSSAATATAEVAVAPSSNSESDLYLRAVPMDRDPNAAAAEQLERHFNTEAYDRIHDNPFLNAMQNPLSTFSIDVDTASYSNVRRFLQAGQRPPKDAVRIEELLNYFPYDYAPPEKKSEDPFATHVEIASCPWNTAHRLVRVGIKGKEIAADKRPASNLVFLIDVSGSMNEPNKLPLVKSALRMLTEQLNGEDRVAMVVYAGNAGLVLPSTPCTNAEKQSILNALDNLEAGGSTNGAQGIEQAYKVAQENFIKGGTNRVILCTDGDFNVGVTNQGDLTRMIEEKAKGGVFLSVMGFGMGNLKDSTMEKLADKGNGNYAYIDTPQEAHKEFVEEISSTLVTIAKDVKIQIEFNPAVVDSYRLIGYENRLLAKEDFNNDKKDAGEIGAGHAVTALYETVSVGEKPAPAAATQGQKEVDDLHFQKPAQVVDNDHAGDMLILKLRYKQPDGEKSKLIEITVKDDGKRFDQASGDFKFASAVAAFGMILRDSPHKGSANFGTVEELASDGVGKDEGGYRREFMELVKKEKELR